MIQTLLRPAHFVAHSTYRFLWNRPSALSNTRQQQFLPRAINPQHLGVSQEPGAWAASKWLIKLQTPFPAFRRRALLMLALLFVATVAAYSLSWMIVAGLTPVHLGATLMWKKGGNADVLTAGPGGPAEKAGLRAGDRIVSVNGRRMADPRPFPGYPFCKYVMLGASGDTVQLGIKRPGATHELSLPAVLQPHRVRFRKISLPKILVLRLLDLYPLFYLIVGATVLFLRLQHWNAWGLALLFAGCIAEAPLAEGTFPPSLRGFAIFYEVLFRGLAPAIFYWFFAVFPVSAPIDRRVPRLKWIFLAVMGTYSVPLAFACLLTGDRTPVFRIFGWQTRTACSWVIFSFAVAVYSLGFASLIWNSARPPTREARRKTRVIVWGTLVGFGPAFTMSVVGEAIGKGLEDFPFWLWTMAVLATMLMPVSYAYAVVKDRVLDIPVLLRRSARYLIVQRGFVFMTLLVSIVAILLFIAFFTQFFRNHGNMTIPASLSIGIVFGIVSVVANLQVVPRVTKMIDRSFFRGAYDAREVLEHLAQKSRAAAGREQLAEMLDSEIDQALHPAAIGVYFQDGQCELKLQRSNGSEVPALPDRHLLDDLAKRGEPIHVRHEQEASNGFGTALHGAQLECLVPILSSQGRLTGVIALGSLLSEEPYSGEDKRLLTSVAIQAGVALENISLAENMAVRIEAERHVTQEMDFARKVQARLLPQKQPRLETLEYVGGCIQARQVGGDYYDFLELRAGRVALVMADIAGKGVSGALLMANLQANLRSQYAMALDDIGGFLKSVNRLFYENTSETSYATLFFSEYDDSTRRLRYVNCGHLPPLILRGEAFSAHKDPASQLERLNGTATVLGLFEKWNCSIEEMQLYAGDLLVLYTDGVTEAPNLEWKEFGESRLRNVIEAHADLPVSDIWKSIIAAVQGFSRGEQSDDITLIVARCTA
jgi:phosphoserine phosphatase RsbU/P